MRPALAVASALALAACAPTGAGDQTSMAHSAGPSQPRQCFMVSQVNNYSRGGDEKIYLKVGRRDVYELTAAGGCPDMDFARQMALVPEGGTVGTRLCTDDMARVVVPGPNEGPSTCRVRVKRQLTEAEVAALPARQRL